MDTTEKEQLAQEQMDQLKDALKKSATKEVENTGAVSGIYGHESLYYSPVQDTITLSSNYNNTITGGGYHTSLSGLNYPNTISGGPYTISSGTSATNWAAPITTDGSGQLKLEGDKADIVINGVSLLEVLKDRLAVMIPNPALEKEWTELKELGEKYRALEADIKEKAEIWKKLKG